MIFREVLDNVARADRVLTQPGGSLVLAGRSGVGRRTAVMLVAHMHQVNVISPKVSRSYGSKQFKNDLKTVSAAVTKQGLIVNEYYFLLSTLLILTLKVTVKLQTSDCIKKSVLKVSIHEVFTFIGGGRGHNKRVHLLF